MNQELEEFVQHELAQLSGSVQHQVASNPAMSQRLFYRTDAAGRGAAVRNRTLRAVDWRRGCEPSLVRYGAELVEAFLGEPQGAPVDWRREQFRHATLTNFNPSGTHFDGFVARLFECAQAPASLPCHAFELCVAHLPVRASASDSGKSMQLLSAIYSHEQQFAIVRTIYQTYEDYFVSTVDRFGAQDPTRFLTSCWDKFRHDIGTFLMRFRHPASFEEREWIAIALVRPHQEAEPVVFEMIDNRLVPSVAFEISLPPDRLAKRGCFDYNFPRRGMGRDGV